ncbi:PREDICTED: Z-DNA-binding protein 1-like [Galeopterus variegatus]|uniref:Z-DNA-binding protein 1-like n=1 Tax=Galeopterus variegatus TaxID=482537 RepID=A0ABM0QT75_GALVR|nr:PREDICTED: Z-DNA-binding protein 1-like [Galeopterus variegatus]
MAEAPAGPDRGGHLEQKILQVLRDAGSPVKTSWLVTECQVPKKELNQVLYRMKKELKISLAAPATWCFGGGGSEGEVSAGLAQPSQAVSPQPDAAAIAENPGSQLSKRREEEIYRFLEDNGSQRALIIAQALGMRTAKDINPDLYKMKDKHLLDFDKKSKAWTIYRPEDSGRRNQSTPTIYQQNPINMICQNGPNSLISISNSNSTQIGHGNVIMTQLTPGEDGSTAPHYLPSTAPGDSSTQGPLADVWGPQDIHVEQSILRRVQLGHSNEMSVHSIPSEGPTHRLPGSPPVSATTDGPEASFEVRMPKPGLHPEGDASQRVHIKSCFLEDASIGSRNRMTVGPGATGPGDAASGDRESGADTDPSPEATQCRSDFLRDVGQDAPSYISTLTLQLEAVTLGNGDPETAGHSRWMDGTPDVGSPGGGSAQGICVSSSSSTILGAEPVLGTIGPQCGSASANGLDKDATPTPGTAQLLKTATMPLTLVSSSGGPRMTFQPFPPLVPVPILEAPPCSAVIPEQGPLQPGHISDSPGTTVEL